MPQLCQLLVPIALLLLLLGEGAQAAPRRKVWFIPTRLTARIPCLTESQLLPGHSIEQQQGRTALCRWVQENGNVIGSGFYQTVRLLQMPVNHQTMFNNVSLVCMMFDWSAQAIDTLLHEIHFYESPTLTSTVTVSFRSKKNFTDFVKHLDTVNFAHNWCLKNQLCIEALVAPVRSPALEYPRLVELAAAYNRTPLGDLLAQLDRASVTGVAEDPLFHVNFVLRTAASAEEPDLCNPSVVQCSKRLLTGRRALALQYSEAAVAELSAFADARATVRKLMTPNQQLTRLPTDALNFTLQLNFVSVCPPGYEPVNETKWQKSEYEHRHNGTALTCLPCMPGTHGPNGLNCFHVPRDTYSNEWGAVEPSPCPDYYLANKPGATSRDMCRYNGTFLEMLAMKAMQYAWSELESVLHGSNPGLWTAVIIAYIFCSAYALFWQLNKLITAVSYQHRRSMTDRLLKRFIAEAYLRDLRRLQYWKTAVEQGKINVDPVD